MRAVLCALLAAVLLSGCASATDLASGPDAAEQETSGGASAPGSAEQNEADEREADQRAEKKAEKAQRRKQSKRDQNKRDQNSKNKHSKKNKQSKKKRDGRDAMTLPRGVGKVTWFTSPSGNIGCRIWADAVRCDIAERDYRSPRKRRNCRLDYGNAFVVGAARARVLCASDTVLGAPRTLGYGRSTTVGRFGCVSRQDGMRCYNLRTRRGFVVSRAAFRLL